MTTQHFPLTGPINLDVRVSVGAIVVQAEDDVDTAEVELIPRREDSDVLARTRVGLDGRTLSIRGPKGKGWSLDKLQGPTTCADIVDVHIRVPSGTAMRLASYGAQSTVSGRAGSVVIATGAGTSTLERVDGDLVARFANATLDVGRVDGSAVLRFSDGRAHLGEVAGDVTLACGNGDVEVDAARGSVRARTGSGAVSIGRAAGDIDMATGSGVLSVGLRPGQPARLDIVTGHGRLISDLDVSDAEPMVEPGIGEPAITIKARTGNGDVRLFRANA